MDYQELKLLEDGLWEAADQLRANSRLTASEDIEAQAKVTSQYVQQHIQSAWMH
jgi:hypothetical protein